MKLSKIAAGIAGIAFAVLTLGAVAGTTPALAAGSSGSAGTRHVADSTTYSQVYQVAPARFSATITKKCAIGYHMHGAMKTSPDITVSSPYITRAAGSFHFTNYITFADDPSHTLYAEGFSVKLYNWSITSSHKAVVSWTCDSDR